jgi:hypothetical protein
MRVSNTSFDWVAKFSDLTGASLTTHVVTQHPKPIRMYASHLGTREKLKSVLESILPFLIIKKGLAEEVLKWYAEHPPQPHGKLKLSEDAVKEIRAIHVPGKYGYRQIAKRFGVHRATVAAIIRGDRR